MTNLQDSRFSASYAMGFPCVTVRVSFEFGWFKFRVRFRIRIRVRLRVRLRNRVRFRLRFRVRTFIGRDSA